jgi:hypothetical protein
MVTDFILLASLGSVVSFAAQGLLLSVAACIAHRAIMAKLSPFTGPRLPKMTDLWILRYDLRGKLALKPGSPEDVHSADFDRTGQRTSTIQALHSKYGSVVQISPSSVSFSSANALRDIFNHTPKLSRPRGDAEFLEHFGQVNTASTWDGQLHFKRRKAIAGVYAAPVVSNESTQAMMNDLIDKFMANLHEAATSEGSVDIWSQLRWLAADTMARLVYGEEVHLDLLGDKKGDRDMMEYLLGSRLTEAETTTLSVLLTSWFHVSSLI